MAEHLINDASPSAQRSGAGVPSICVFDVNETLLDIEFLAPLGSIHNVSIQKDDIEELRTRLLTMPAHPDVPAGLKQLKDVGFRLVTLTNSPPDPQTSPLKHAGIDGWFEKSFSIDRVRRFKPAPQMYHMVAEELDVPPAAICMVAAHVWDTIGAQSVGCSGA